MLEWVVTSGVLVILVLLIRRLFKGKISLRLQYGLWLLVLVRLLVPVNLFDTDLSVLNLLSAQSDRETSAAGPVAGAVDPQPVAAAPEFLTGMASQQTGVQEDNLPEGAHSSAPGGEEPIYHNVESVSGISLLPKLLRGVWIGGIFIAAAVLGGINLHFFRRLRRARKPLESGGGNEGVLRGRKYPAVYVVQGLSGPCLFGLIHPAIYLPEGITEEQMPYVLAHEESHYRAGDHIWSLFRSLCLALHWYHPLVWLAAYVSRQDSELACDERTIRYLGEERRNVYGRMLVDLTVAKMSAADFLCCATTMTADGRSLKERVQLIANKPRMLAATGGLVAALLVAVSCVACTGAKDNGTAEPDTALDGVLDDMENNIPEISDGSGEEEPSDNSDRNESADRETADIVSPAEDYIYSDNEYYRVVTGTTIEDPWFTMEVPESLVGQVAYGVTLEENEAGEKYLRALSFFHVESVMAGTPQDALRENWWKNYWSGWLCGYSWTGYPDIEEDLEEIAYRSGTWDIRGMEFLLAWDYDGYAGISGRLVQANEAGTGAYFYVGPSDVQWTPETEEGYMACAEALAACWDHFAAKSFPYEELEGYLGDASAEMPRWRQDFETAEMVYGWFTALGQAPVKAASGIEGDYVTYTTPDGFNYDEADVPGVSSMEDFRDYLNRYFAPEIADGLMSGQRPALEFKASATKGKAAPFIEVDGQLCVLVGWITENVYYPNKRQYAAYFWEITETGQQRPIRMYAENGGRRRVQIYTDCQYNTHAPEPLRAILCYTMEEQEDGSWRIVDDYELAVIQMLYPEE